MKHDYDLSELEEIKVRNLRYFIMPRYKHHYVSNDYEDFSLDIMLHDLSENSNFVDIGSHYGIYSLTAAQKASKGQVVAIEPVAENFQILNKNVKSNNFSNVRTFNFAASDETGEAEFNIPWASDSAGFYEHPNAETIKKVKIGMIKPDELLKDKKIDFIKIDTEGHEIHVLDGLKNTLKTNPSCKLLIEFNPDCLVRAGAKPIDLINKVIGLGKAVLIVDEQNRELINITNHPERWEGLVGQSGYANIYCVPVASFSQAVFVLLSAQPGGAELAVLDLVNDLRKEGLVSHFIVPSEGPVTSALKEKAIGYSVSAFGGWAHQEKLEPLKKRQNDAWNMKAVQEITDVVERLDPDVVISNTIVLPWGAVVAAGLQKPHVWIIHEYGNLDHGLEFEYGYEEVLRTIDHLSDKVVANSINIKKHLSKTIDAKKILQVHWRYDLKEIDAKSHERSKKIFSSEADIKLVLAGRVNPPKGQLDAVLAVAALTKKGIKAELSLIGEIESTDYKRKIEDQIKLNKLDGKVTLAGHIDNPMPLIAQADLALVCSTNEAFGRVTVEAMLLGKPVIGANSGATSYLIEDGKNGLRYKVGDWQELSDKIEQLYKDKAKLKKIGIQARIYSQNNFTSDRYVKELYKNILSLKGATPSSSDEVHLYDKFVNFVRVANDRVALKDNQLHEYELRIGDLERQNDALKGSVKDIHGSRSWKVARTLSKGKHGIKRIIK